MGVEMTDQTESIAQNCILKISMNLPFKDEVHILEAVKLAVKAGIRQEKLRRKKPTKNKTK